MPAPVVILDAWPDRLAPLPNGWTGHDGFTLPASPWDLSAKRLVCVGTVADDEAAALSLLALTRGVGLVVVVDLRAAARQRYLEDLHKVTESVGPPAEPAPLLSPVQEGLLRALAEGATVTQAATQLFLSRRSANRRLAEARARLGVATNAEAVRAWASAGPNAPGPR